MKLTLAVVALMVLASQSSTYELPSVGNSELAHELQEFVDVLPVDEIVDLTKRYLSRDKEFRMVMKIVLGDEIKRFIDDLEAMPEFLKFTDFLHKNGIDIYTFLRFLKETMAMEPAKVDEASNCKITGGFYGYTKDLDEILPWQYISNMFEYKIEMSKVFNEFIDECLSAKYTNLFTASFTNRHFLNVMHQLDKLEIDSETFRVNFTNLLLIEAFFQRYV